MFGALFGRNATHEASAPGRVNLIGEHTDYNGGFVLPVALPQRARVALAARQDRRVRVASANVGEPAPYDYELGDERPRGRWVDYVQGVTAVARAEGLLRSGFEALIDSDVPIGAGLASSAALEVALLRALRAAGPLSEADDLRLAEMGWRAENEFVGARVGIMDQLCATFGSPGTALFIDTRSRARESVPLPSACELVAVHSGISHDNAGGLYNTRRQECEQACRLLGIEALRDARLEDLDPLPEPLRGRARHVVTENARVLAAVDALRRPDLPALGELLRASHRSLRDDYAVSIPEIDLLVELASRHPETFGARLTGGGFGGSIVAIVRRGAGASVARAVSDAYARGSGLVARVLLPLP